MRHILSSEQVADPNLWKELFARAGQLERQPARSLEGKLLATLFYEPSTRTRFSFEAAMQRLGGGLLSAESAGQFSSAVKGETLEDGIRVVSAYVDAIVLRHPQVGSAQLASTVSRVPVINAGDGAGEHPSQALLDLYTIQKELGQPKNLQVVMVGDLLNGRTIHSLLRLLVEMPEVEVSLVAPPALQLPEKYQKLLRDKGLAFQLLSDWQSVLPVADVLYMTRVQKERFADPAEYEALKDAYVLRPAELAKMKEKSIVLHPLPRVGEIDPAVDADHRAAYFRQAENGMYLRMALLEYVMLAHE